MQNKPIFVNGSCSKPPKIWINEFQKQKKHVIIYGFKAINMEKVPDNDHHPADLIWSNNADKLYKENNSNSKPATYFDFHNELSRKIETLTNSEILKLCHIAYNKLNTRKMIFQTLRKTGNDYFDLNRNQEIIPNYKGDWTILLFERYTSSDTFEKYLAIKYEILNDNETSTPTNFLTKPKDLHNYHYQEIKNYFNRLRITATETEYTEAKIKNRKQYHFGEASFNNNTSTIFKDGSQKDTNKQLSGYQKNIIESHEKGHTLRTFNILRTKIHKGFDFNQIKDEENLGYLKRPDELIERMSQLKNYFGMKANDFFSRNHLNYARQNYIKDTDLDNDMSNFFKTITPQTEGTFLEIMNNYPI